VAEADTAEIALGQFDRPAGQAATGGQGHGIKMAHTYQDAPVRLDLQPIEGLVPVFFLGERPVGGLREDIDNGWIPVAGELWQKLVANAVAGEIERGVGGILSPTDIALSEVGADLFARCFDQRADDAIARDGADPGESCGAGPAEEAEEDGLGLIVAGVAESDAVGFATLDHGPEKVEAEASGGLFQIVAGGNGGVMEVKGQAETVGQVSNKGGVGVGFGAAEAMVDVEEADGEVQVVEEVEETDGVGAAGDGDGDARAGG
jgi:hypothetical protein